MFINKQKKEQIQKGFTLIEMLVSVALFSVVLTVMMGTIVTIADSNKKARSLMSVMNNLNFAVDSMTRSIKSGDLVTPYGTPNCITTDQIDYNGSGTARQIATYCFVETTAGIGRIDKTVAGKTLPLTSPDVDVDYLEFRVYIPSGDTQPRVSISLQGTVKISEKVSSQFTIQTTVAQRKLKI